MAATPKPIRKVLKKSTEKERKLAQHKAKHGSIVDEPGKHHVFLNKQTEKSIRKKRIDIGSHMRKK